MNDEVWMTIKKQAPSQALHVLLGAFAVSGALFDNSAALYATVAAAQVIGVGVHVGSRVAHGKPVLFGDATDKSIAVALATLMIIWGHSLSMIYASTEGAMFLGAVAATVGGIRELLQFPVDRVNDMVVDMTFVTLGGVLIAGAQALS